MFSAELQRSAPSICTFFEAALHKNKLFHAYLLCGSDLAMKEKFCLELSQILNCKTKNACGTCQSCLWFANSNHPELPVRLEANLEKSKKGVILLEQTQKLLAKLQNKSAFYRVVLLSKAETEFLPPESANALLKTIEEPKPQIVFLLCAQNEQLVLATIKSRCQVIHFPNAIEFAPSSQANQAFNSLVNAEASWFQLSQLASQVIDSENSLIDFIDGLQIILLENQRVTNQTTQILEGAKIRLKAFCSAKPVMEELFWDLKQSLCI